MAILVARLCGRRVAPVAFPLAAGAAAPEDDVDLEHLVAVLLVGAQVEVPLAGRAHVEELVAGQAHEVMVALHDVGVVALGPLPGRHLEKLAHGDELVQGVVDGGEADLGEPSAGPGVDGLGREVDVLAAQDLGDDAPLGGHAPPPRPQPFEQVDHQFPGYPIGESLNST